ncbi:DsbA family oxidoreductase [Muricoccus radiodurans]|uniref:DsbA family oxidoreductase n=1 Tax=Muricoccus radiodurans TaxID=2231721 RepID=UPI003CEECD28
MDASANPILLVVSDTICPWCWIGKRRLDKALATLAPEGLRFERRWHPFMLNPTMPPKGMERAAYRAAKFGSPERSAAIDARITAEGARDGLTFRFDRITRTPSTRDSHRLIRLAGQEGGAPLADAVAEALFSAYFAEGRDIGDPATLAALADAAGLPPGRAAAMLATEEGLAEVEEDAARAAGLGGVPAVVLGRRLVIQGAQPAEEAALALRDAMAAA